MLLTEETALVVLLAELLLPLLRDDCKEEATTVPRGLVVLRDTTLALVLPLRVVPLLVDLVDDDDDAGDACPDEAPELLRVGGVGLAVAAEEDTETEQKQRKRNRAVKKKLNSKQSQKETKSAFKQTQKKLKDLRTIFR